LQGKYSQSIADQFEVVTVKTMEGIEDTLTSSSSESWICVENGEIAGFCGSLNYRGWMTLQII
jgi:hypothetical protein